jgi:hypothetical protein
LQCITQNFLVVKEPVFGLELLNKKYATVLKEYQGALVTHLVECTGVERETISAQLNLAKDFMNYEDEHFHIMTVSKITDGNKSSTVIEADIAVLGSTEAQKALLTEEQISSTTGCFGDLPPFEQGLMREYMPKMQDALHVNPTQLAKHTVGLRNAYNKRTAAVQNDLAADNPLRIKYIHEILHSGTLASFVNSPEGKAIIARLTLEQIQALSPSQAIEILALNTDSTQNIAYDAVFGAERQVMEQIRAAITAVKADITLDALQLNTFGAKLFPHITTGIEKIITDLAARIPANTQEQITMLGYLKNAPNSNFEAARAALVAIQDTLSADEYTMWECALTLKNNLPQPTLLIPDLAAMLSTLGHIINSSTTIPLEPEQQTALYRRQIVMCKSGKDRTGLFLLNATIKAIMRETGQSEESVVEALVRSGHAQLMPGMQGGTHGCEGIKPYVILTSELEKHKSAHTKDAAMHNNFKDPGKGDSQTILQQARIASAPSLVHRRPESLRRAVSTPQLLDLSAYPQAFQAANGVRINSMIAQAHSSTPNLTPRKILQRMSPKLDHLLKRHYAKQAVINPILFKAALLQQLAYAIKQKENSGKSIKAITGKNKVELRALIERNPNVFQKEIFALIKFDSSNFDQVMASPLSLYQDITKDELIVILTTMSPAQTKFASLSEAEIETIVAKIEAHDIENMAPVMLECFVNNLSVHDGSFLDYLTPDLYITILTQLKKHGVLNDITLPVIKQIVQNQVLMTLLLSNGDLLGSCSQDAQKMFITKFLTDVDLRATLTDEKRRELLTTILEDAGDFIQHNLFDTMVAQGMADQVVDYLLAKDTHITTEIITGLPQEVITALSGNKLEEFVDKIAPDAKPSLLARLDGDVVATMSLDLVEKFHSATTPTDENSRTIKGRMAEVKHIASLLQALEPALIPAKKLKWYQKLYQWLVSKKSTPVMPAPQQLTSSDLYFEAKDLPALLQKNALLSGTKAEQDKIIRICTSPVFKAKLAKDPQMAAIKLSFGSTQEFITALHATNKETFNKIFREANKVMTEVALCAAAINNPRALGQPNSPLKRQGGGLQL